MNWKYFKKYFKLLEWLNDNHLDVAVDWWKYLEEEE